MFLFLSDEGRMLETLDYTICIAVHRPFYISIYIQFSYINIISTLVIVKRCFSRESLDEDDPLDNTKLKKKKIERIIDDSLKV